MGHRCWTHCPHGHEFTPENIIWINRKTGERHRRCRTCHREGAKMWRVYKRDYRDSALERERGLRVTVRP